MRCKHHFPVQHRDAKPPWCNVCGLTADYKNPTSKLDRNNDMSAYITPTEKALTLVFNEVAENLETTDATEFFPHDVYLVWFCYILGGWKALISTTLPDGMYYEVTYNKEKEESYIDFYKKFRNTRVPDVN